VVLVEAAAVSFHPCHERRALQARVMPMVRAVADRWRPQLEEWSIDLAPGRDVLIPVGPPRPCAHCHGQRRILDPGPLGYIAVVCGRCHGAGFDPS
jgi:hypothetical protein